MSIDRDRARLYALALGAGLVAEIGLALAIRQSSGDNRYVPLLFFVEAIVLGLVFGARPGMAGAVAPMLVLFAVAVALDDLGGESPTAVFAALLFVMIVQAFLAGMAGAMRDRYWRRTGLPPDA